MSKEQAFLLKNAARLPTVECFSIYDEEQQLLVVESTGYPVVLTSMGITHSKTHAHPGDDDPDPGAEKCY